MYIRLIVIILTLICSASSVSGQESAVVIAFAETSHDFETLKKGKTYKHDFEYVNNGESPVVILDVKVACTCTKVKWSKKPLKRGEKEVLTVSYVARDTGAFRKDITVKTNTLPKEVVLTVKGVVEK